MAPTVTVLDRIGDFTLRIFDDPNDIVAKKYSITKNQILYKSDFILGINIHKDIEDYSIFWYGTTTYGIFLEASYKAYIDIKEKVEKKMKRENRYTNLKQSEDFCTCHMLFADESKHEEVGFPFDMNYFSIMNSRGLTFIRVDMPYVDTWADLYPISYLQHDIKREIGLTSFYNISDNIIEFFLETINANKNGKNEGYYIIEKMLSFVLNDFENV